MTSQDYVAALDRSEILQKTLSRVHDVSLAGLPIDPRREYENVVQVIVPTVTQSLLDERAKRRAGDELRLQVCADKIGALTVAERVLHRDGEPLAVPSPKPADPNGLTSKIAENQQHLKVIVDARDSTRSTAVIALSMGIAMALLGFGGLLSLIATSQGLFEDGSLLSQWVLAGLLALTLLTAGVAISFFRKGAPSIRPPWASAVIILLLFLFFIRYVSLGSEGDPNLEAAWPRGVWSLIQIGATLGIAAAAVVLEIVAGSAMTIWWAYISRRGDYAEAEHLLSISNEYQALREKLAVSLAQEQVSKNTTDLVNLACGKIADCVSDALQPDQVRLQQASALKDAPPTGALNERIDWDAVQTSVSNRRDAAEELRRLGSGLSNPTPSVAPSQA